MKTKEPEQLTKQGRFNMDDIKEFKTLRDKSEEPEAENVENNDKAEDVENANGEESAIAEEDMDAAFDELYGDCEKYEEAEEAEYDNFATPFSRELPRIAARVFLLAIAVMCVVIVLPHGRSTKTEDGASKPIVIDSEDENYAEIGTIVYNKENNEVYFKEYNGSGYSYRLYEDKSGNTFEFSPDTGTIGIKK